MTTNLLLLAVAAMLAWLVVRWDRQRSALRRRQRLEDALKHLFEQEYRGRRGTIASLAVSPQSPQRRDRTP